VGPREFYDTMPSTQDRAIALARQGAPVGTRVVARHQSLGRGRLSRAWESPAGGLYCSMVLPRPDAHAGLLPLAVGAQIASALHDRYGVPLTVKWPNDILVRAAGGPARKLSGILTDEVASPSLGRAIVAGVGVNVRLDLRSLPPTLRARVASLDEFARPPPELDEVETLVADAALAAAEDLRDPDGAERARALCRAFLYGVGEPVTVDGRPAGTIEGLGDDGELWLATPTDRVAIWAGDVRLEGDR
jgi:BirA family transcriptional regulator, biotin operon repressor / biotin---[acetyl-CoA-carboxylase] ligase